MVGANSLDPNQRRIATQARELESRTSDGIHVQLLWYPLDGHVSVSVNDTKTGETFELEARHGQYVLDVYRHPYAYAPPNLRSAKKGLSSSVGSRG